MPSLNLYGVNSVLSIPPTVMRHRVVLYVAIAAMALLLSPLFTPSAEAATFTLMWDPSAEADVTGYLVSVGTASGQYSSTADVANQLYYQFTPPNPAISYYFAVRAYTSTGLTSGYSQEVQSAPSAAVTPPSVLTGGAISVTTSGAILTGTGNPNGSSTNAYFQYGLTSGYGSGTPLAALGSGASAVAIGNGGLTGMTCGTLYHFRATATNGGGTASGADATLTTAPCPLPAVTTGSATSIAVTGATLTGTVNPNGVATQAYFAYGLSTAYGSTTLSTSVGPGTQNTAIGGGSITGLICNTSYHFRAEATSASGKVLGADAVFTTGACPTPIVTTGSPISTATNGATLTGSVDPQGSTTNVSFQYGPSTGYGNSTPSAVLVSPGSVAIPISGLSCDAPYHFRALATNSGGTTYGADASFRTAVCSSSPLQAPVISVQPASQNVKSGRTATLSVQVSDPVGQLAYQWYIVTRTSNNLIVGATSSTYTTFPITSATSFIVRVSNQSGSTDSAIATITTWAPGRRK